MGKIFKGNQYGRPITTLERFNKNHIKVESGCWEWQGYRNKKGYGTFEINGKGTVSNRISYILFIGELESNMLVCHKCDNPCCVNPFHLFKGTNRDNFEDAVSKGRKFVSPHPSVQTYARGCRCVDCKKAKSERRKKYKINKINSTFIQK